MRSGLKILEVRVAQCFLSGPRIVGGGTGRDCLEGCSSGSVEISGRKGMWETTVTIVRQQVLLEG